MAKIKGNIIMANISGMLGKQIVVKSRNGKPYASAAPTIDENKPLTPNKKAYREKFLKKTAYAKAAAKDPVSGKDYRAAAKNGLSAYNVAFMDASYPPEVTAVSTQGYSGKPGDKIFIQAKDDFKVTVVKISIYSASGELIEEGGAVSDDILWMYNVVNVNENIAGSKIIAKAFDLPGNEGTMELIL